MMILFPCTAPRYPRWLWEREKPSPTYGDLSLMFIQGHRIEDANLYLYKTFLRKHRKIVIKINNLRMKKSNKNRTHIKL